MKSPQTKIPQCFTLYEPKDSVCDGDASAEGDTPCCYRDQCSAFKRAQAAGAVTLTDHGRMVPIVDVNGAPDKYFRPLDWDQFLAKLAELVDEFGGHEAHGEETPAEVEAVAESGEVAEAQIGTEAAPQKRRNTKGRLRRKKRRKPGRKARAMAARALIRAARERRRALLEEFKLFRQQLAEHLPEYHWSLGASAIPPGRLYIKNRLLTSGYASVYCKTASGRDRPLAMLRFKPRGLLMEVALPVEPGEVSKAAAAKLELKPYNDGSFSSITKKLDRAGLGLAAEVIAQAVRNAKLELPSARRPYGWKP